VRPHQTHDGRARDLEDLKWLQAGLVTLASLVRATVAADATLDPGDLAALTDRCDVVSTEALDRAIEALEPRTRQLTTSCKYPRG
jgi:hypothetical protein